MFFQNKINSENSYIFTLPRPCNFDLSQIFDCGQAFRFNKLQSDRNTYCGVAFSKYIEITQTNSELIFKGITKQDFDDIFYDYFDLDTDYQNIIESFSDDEVLYTAAKFARGIRILKQDKWEALCSFIISQNNNIPRIKGIIENMSKAFGEKILCFDGVCRYAFPTAKALYDAGQQRIFELKTGFRAKYIFDAAKKVCEGSIDLDSISQMPTDKALVILQQICGVGPKVAACTLLFGFAKYDAFPVDVWVKRILNTYYSKKQSRHFSLSNAGIAQQYLFYYERCKNNIYL